MKIGIDATMFCTEKNFTGIPRSVHEILKIWAENHPEHEYYLLCPRPMISTLDFEMGKNWHIIDKPWIIDKKKLWTLFRLPSLVHELDLDAYWGTNYTLPRKTSKKTKYYLTIYDLALFKFRNIGATFNTIRIKLFAKMSCKRATKVIAISNATAKDIHEIFGIPKEKIVVSYCGGLPHGYKIPEEQGSNVDNPLLSFRERFFLFLSTIEPRKNILTIIKAFEKFKEDTKTDYKLVLAGQKGWKSEDIYRSIEQSKYHDHIILPGYISLKDKTVLMKNAIAFVYPSLYEGFGIPILEAFANDLPVLTSRNSSLPEVGGEAALYINDSLDYVGLADNMKIIAFMEEGELSKLKEKMKTQLVKFSWEKNAEEMLKILNGK